MRLNTLFAAAFGLGIVASGCAAPGGTPTVETLVAAARADAAQRSGRDPASLPVVSAEAVTWSDGSLGCPRPGMMYTQALVPGWRVRLRVGDETWHYHADARGNLALCPADRARDPAPGGPARM